ncbi:MAG: hypothetical protein KA163_00710 [Bacteroidia bacterium]|nr:hypothetical protein [Bacteroidia bacterium]
MKKILIIFPDAHLAYSPTTLQIQNALKEHFTCKIFCFKSDYFHQLNETDIIYAKRLFGIGRLITILHKIFPLLFKRGIQFSYRKAQLMSHLIFNRYHEIIYVDLISMAYCGNLYKPGTLVSLELTNNTVSYLDQLNKKINYLIIQNEERKNIYFSNLNCKVFYVQNAPDFDEQQIQNYPQKKENRLVFGGTALLGFGILFCLDFIKQNEVYELILKGSIPKEVNELMNEQYKQELNTGKIIVQREYQNDSEYLMELSECIIGFAFYDIKRKEFDNINYKTGPAGKMFKYFAAGVPVIANNLPGFYPVAEFNAGILIDEINNSTIANAIHKIRSDYEYYQKNCFKAAAHFSFKKSINPYIKRLVEN